MKKILLSFIISALLISYSNAQFFSAGLKAGAQACAVAYSPSLDADLSGIIGFHAGGFAKLKSPIKIGAKLEALYSTRGGDVSQSFESGGVTTEINAEFRAAYVDVPLLVTFNIIKPLAIEAGPQFSFLMSGETSGPGGSVDYEPNNSPEIGFAAGLDLNLPKKFGAYIRYNMGFNSVTETEVDPISNEVTEFNTDITQSWIQFGVKYRIVEPI